MRTTSHAPLFAAAAALLAAAARAQEAAFALNGSAADEGTGCALAFAGDTNGDGFGDFLVGAHGAASFTGRADLRSGADGSLLRSFTGSGPFTEWGFALCGLGDVDGDSRSDVLVASPWAGSAIDSGKGRAIAYSGASGLPLWQIDGVKGNDQLGYAVCGSGDLNGDGRNDVLVSVPGFDGAGGLFNVGSVRAYSGLNGQMIYQADGTLVEGSFGAKLAALGDIDGDGVRDWIAGASSFATGQVSVRSGATGAPLHTYSGPNGTDGWGQGVAGIGDANGDGVPDFALTKKATLGIYSGASFALIRETATVATISLPSQPIAGAGDMDGDGIEDLLVHSGSPKVLSGANLSVLWTQPGLATALAAGSDFNGGGRPDVLIGNAFAGPPSFAGRAELRMPYDMLLAPSSNPVVAGTPLTVTNRAGVAGRPVGTMLLAVSGMPIPMLLKLGLFDAQGVYSWTITPPAAVAGFDFTFVHLSSNLAYTEGRFSNPITILVQ